MLIETGHSVQRISVHIFNFRRLIILFIHFYYVRSNVVSYFSVPTNLDLPARKRTNRQIKVLQVRVHFCISGDRIRNSLEEKSIVVTINGAIDLFVIS